VTHLPTGKLPSALLEELLSGLTEAPEVRLGPAIGEDACVIDVPAGALVVAADPITLTSAELGGHAVLINANDVAATGVRPRWFLATLLLPPDATADSVREIFASMQRALAECDAYLVGGHTEVTSAVRQPVIAGQMLGFAEDGRIVPTGGVRPGDVLVQAGAAPVEGAAVFASEAAERLAGLDDTIVAAARAAVSDPGISIVEPALIAATHGATALHDPTEGGLAAGLDELARASGVKLSIDRDAVEWFEPGLAICRALGADPWRTLASGTLLAAFAPEAVDAARAAIESQGTPTCVLGHALDGAGAFALDGEAILAPARDEVARLLD
jgi:hydrogenase expression/formation protein HypE